MALLGLIIFSQAEAAAKSYGTLRVSSSSAIIYHGAALNAKQEGVAKSGTVFTLRDEGLIHGFYKIENKGHISYINSGDVVLLDANGDPIDDGGDDIVPTKVPTRAPTAKTTLAPTKAPTRVSNTNAPTPLPIVVVPPVPPKTGGVDPGTKPEATVRPTQALSREVTYGVTPQPTRVPTALPSAVPTRAPVVAPAPTPLVRQGRGKALPPRKQGGAASGVLLGQAVLKMQTAKYDGPSERKEGQLSAAMLYLPLGGGNCVPVQPAFKPNPTAADCRCIETSGFVGLGAELRLAPWLRVFADWTAFQHKTKAADKGMPAPLVNVPGGGSVLIDTNAFYVMDTQGLRLGLKASLPFPHVEPYIGGGIGGYFWNAQYMDSDRSVTYGDDKGAAFGVTGILGVDFTFNYGRNGVFRIGPFVEAGAPVVKPTVKDIAGLGVDWKDDVGTPAMVPLRYGLLFGVGF